MTTPTQRTPQQASIEAREAREAWENGLPFQAKCNDVDWYDCHIPSNPDWSNINYHWRTTPATPRVITPGKWKTRNGEVVMIKKLDGPHYQWANVSKASDTWTAEGKYTYGQIGDSPFDLISKVETRWRPWKPEEVPVGSVIKRKSIQHTRHMITSTADERSRNRWLEEFELLLPDGTYSPCGVEEVVG